MPDQTLTRTECVDHFICMKKLYNDAPESEWHLYRSEIGDDPATLATLDTETFEAQRLEVERARPFHAADLNRSELATKRSRFKQYAFTCACNGDLETAFKALKLTHEMDRSASGPKDVRGMWLLTIVGWALHGMEGTLNLLGQHVVPKILVGNCLFVFAHTVRGTVGFQFVEVKGPRLDSRVAGQMFACTGLFE